jgi:hypothetical protein
LNETRVGVKMSIFTQTCSRNTFGGGSDLHALQNKRYTKVCGSGGSWDFLMTRRGVRLYN